MKTMLIALGAVLFGGAAAAEPSMSNDDPMVSVKVSDLDLSTPDGRKRLHLRLRQAVDALCLEVDRNQPPLLCAESVPEGPVETRPRRGPIGLPRAHRCSRHGEHSQTSS